MHTKLCSSLTYGRLKTLMLFLNGIRTEMRREAWKITLSVTSLNFFLVEQNQFKFNRINSVTQTMDGQQSTSKISSFRNCGAWLSKNYRHRLPLPQLAIPWKGKNLQQSLRLDADPFWGRLGVSIYVIRSVALCNGDFTEEGRSGWSLWFWFSSSK